MNKKQRILELEKQVKFLLENANYKKVGVRTRISWCSSGRNQFVKYIYDGKIKETESLGECLFIAKDNKDTCIIKCYRWGAYSYMLLDKKTNAITQLPSDYKPLLETVKGKSLIIDDKKVCCEWERVKTSEQPLLYEIKVNLDRKRVKSFIVNSSCKIKFDDIGAIEFYVPTSELQRIARLGNDFERLTVKLISTMN